jgi:hypothetical protein
MFTYAPCGGGAVWDSGHVFDLIVVLVSSYPLKPHCCLSSFRGFPLDCVIVVPKLLLRGL